MEKTKIKGNLVGYYHFLSKDKSSTYYVTQILTTEDEGLNNKRARLKDIFCDEDTYKNVIQNKEIGDTIEADASINLQTDRVYYKVVM